MSQELPKGIHNIHENNESLLPITPIYRGIYADTLKDGEKLPVGGKMFISPVLDIKLKLDFDSLEGDLSKFTPEQFQESFSKVKQLVEDWLKESNIEMDPYTFFVVQNVQKKVEAMLKTMETSPDDVEGVFSKRNVGYRTEGESNKLSDTIGKSACAERAALGQYLLQKVGLLSSYMSGIRMDDAIGDDSYPENHSVIVIHKEDGDYIYDIARPYITGGEVK